MLPLWQKGHIKLKYPLNEKKIRKKQKNTKRIKQKDCIACDEIDIELFHESKNEEEVNLFLMKNH